MDKIEAIVQRLPHFYAAYDNKSIMYGILKAFADEFDIVVNDYINRSDNDIGIMTTDERDLEWRWGALMGFPRLRNETYERYRMRLVNMVNALRGGTAPAIRYAVALMLGIADMITLLRALRSMAISLLSLLLMARISMYITMMVLRAILMTL